MQLNISEIPENNSGTIPPIKVTKKSSNVKKVAINTNTEIYEYDNIVPSKGQVSYEDILSKMNMYVRDGRLHLKEGRTSNGHTSDTRTSDAPPREDYVGNNQQSYIYNKYFKGEFKEEPTVRKPKTLFEYKQMLLADYLQRERVKQIKSKKIMIPGSTTISYAQRPPQDMNALFNFSKR